ncbi:MAG: DUF4142 domain-containing protein [Asticcacaulis sp.]
MTPLPRPDFPRARSQSAPAPRRAVTASRPPVPFNPDHFVRQVSRLNSLAVSVHHLALRRTGNGDIRAYARHMADSHAWLNEALLTLLEKAGSSLMPDYQPEPARQGELDALSEDDEAHFDIDYMMFQNRLYLDMLRLCERFLHARTAMPNLVIYALTLCDYLTYHLKQFSPALGARQTA